MKIALFIVCWAMLANAAMAAKVQIDKDNRWIVDGKPYFALGISGAPPARFVAPDGKDGWAQLAADGVNWMRIGTIYEPWDAKGLDALAAQMDAAARVGIYGMLNLRELTSFDQPWKEAKLREIVTRFKDHPALAAWKNVDEPAWGEQPIRPIIDAYHAIKELDPGHPVIMNHAPRNTMKELSRYCVACDGTGVDIYPVSVPMGKHSLESNQGLSMVGDYTKKAVDSVKGKKPILIVLQITWSGATPPKNVLIRPTLEQQRYMTYQSIINGANGIMWFGGYIVLNERDQKLGFNWTYWDDVLKPLFKEIGPGTEMYSVITAPRTDIALKVTGADDIETMVRKVDGKTYVIAAKREGAEAEVKLAGLTGSSEADVLTENRKVKVVDGVITDTFKPDSVHVYRIAR